MTTERCPAEPELLAWVDEAQGSESIGAHVETCLACQQQVASIHRSIFRMQERAAVPDTAPGNVRPSQPPGAIGKYLIVGKLPGGRAFESFRGVHPVLHIDVRIDVAREPVPDTAEFRDPLAAEVRRLISIEHPRLSRIRESGYFGDRLFLVADYGRDERLDQQLLSGALALDDAKAILGALADAGIPLVHAGIFPGEISSAGMLVPAAGGLLWTDWGAATVLRPPGANTPMALHQLLACLFVDVVEPLADIRHDRDSALLALDRLRQAGRITAAMESALRTALENLTDPQLRLERFVRHFTCRPGLWSRLFG
jgi:hypothetical protein